MVTPPNESTAEIVLRSNSWMTAPDVETFDSSGLPLLLLTIHSEPPL